MKFPAAIAIAVCLMPCLGRTAELNLATLTCGKYENEVLPASATNPTADSINTVMWLFGYSVAKSGGHVLYPEALASFGFALDGECKSNPAETLLDALIIVKPETKKPMDLSAVECSTFAARHIEVAATDLESANTIMMWLFGFSTAKSGSRIFSADSLGAFQISFLAYCRKHPSSNLFDALSTLKMSKAPE